MAVTYNLSLLRVAVESTFGVDGTGSLTYAPVPTIGRPSLTTAIETIDVGLAKQVISGGSELVVGNKSWTLDFTMPLAGTGTAADDGTTAIQNVLGLLMANTFGGEQLGTGTTFSAGWTANSGDVASAAGLALGTALGWLNPTSGRLEARSIKTIASATITNRLGYSSTPAAAADAYSAATYYVTPQNPVPTLQFILQGADSDDAWVLTGGQLSSISFSVPLGGSEVPTVQFSMRGVDWIKGASAASPPSAITATTAANFEPLSSGQGEFSLQDVGTVTYAGSEVCISSFEWNVELAYGDLTCPSGISGMDGYFLQAPEGAFLTGSFTAPFEDQTRWDEMVAATAKQLQFQVGFVPGKVWVFEAPTVQLTEVSPVDANGLLGVQASFSARNDEDVTGGTTDLHTAGMRIHVM